jgi:hypothetical protein
MATQSIATAAVVRLTLNVGDLPGSVHFYRVLLQSEPVTVSADSARFETELLALTLVKGDARASGGTLNHLGLRLPNSASLVDL